MLISIELGLSSQPFAFASDCSFLRGTFGCLSGEWNSQVLQLLPKHPFFWFFCKQNCPVWVFFFFFHSSYVEVFGGVCWYLHWVTVCMTINWSVAWGEKNNNFVFFFKIASIHFQKVTRAYSGSWTITYKIHPPLGDYPAKTRRDAAR